MRHTQTMCINTRATNRNTFNWMTIHTHGMYCDDGAVVLVLRDGYARRWFLSNWNLKRTHFLVKIRYEINVFFIIS